MGTAEILRYPVSVGSDGSLTVIAPSGGKSGRITLPASVQDGYTFSFQGSYYELVTYSTGRYAVLALDPWLKGKASGHTLFLQDRAESKKPMPEWVSDNRSLLAGLPEYSGSLALRYSKASMASVKKLTANQILKESLLQFVLSKLSNPSDADKAAAQALSTDLASILAPKSQFFTYWIKFLRCDPNAAPKEDDSVSFRKIYGLVLVPETEYAYALQEMRAAMESGKSPFYTAPSNVVLLETLASILPQKRAQPESVYGVAAPPDMLSDIPLARSIRSDAIAVVIGNRTYETMGMPFADFAVNDAELMRAYLVKALGFREENILYLADATLVDFNRIFGTASDPKGQLFSRTKPEVSDVFVYYSGHGAPSIDGKTAYFLPVDCDPAFVKLNGYPLEVLFSNLAKLPSKSLTLILDASFSGSFDKGTPLPGVSIPDSLPKTEELVKPFLKENMTVFISSANSQTASWHDGKKLSLFTYCFAEGIRELASVRLGVIRIGELSVYVQERVENLARQLYSREQTPVFIGDGSSILMEF